jgi:hypothetical protein
LTDLPFITPPSASTEQATDVWNELIECLEGTHRWGGETGEFYIYRLLPYIASQHRESHVALPECEDWCSRCRGRTYYQNANRALYDLCKQFERARGVTIQFDGGHPLEALLDEEPFTHRVHLTVVT